MFFDTNVIIGVLSKSCDDLLFNKVSVHIEEKSAFLSVMVFSELLSYQGLSEDEGLKLKNYLIDNYILVEIDIEIATIAARIVKEMRIETGKKLKLTDAVIAATAIYYNMDLCTLDKEDFKKIKSIYF